jgi:hypothetical protein
MVVAGRMIVLKAARQVSYQIIAVLPDHSNAPKQIEEDNESHRKETESTHFRNGQEFKEVMNSRIDPSSTLRQENCPTRRRDGVSDSIGRKFHLESGKVLHHQCREVSIFTQREKVLLVEGVHVRLGILVDDPAGNDDWPTLVGSSDSVDTETSRKTSDGTEQALKSFGKVVGNVVLVDLPIGRFSSCTLEEKEFTHLNHRGERLLLIGNLCLSANPNDGRIVGRARNHSIQRIGRHTLCLRDEVSIPPASKPRSRTVSASTWKMYS